MEPLFRPWIWRGCSDRVWPADSVTPRRIQVDGTRVASRRFSFSRVASCNAASRRPPLCVLQCRDLPSRQRSVQDVALCEKRYPLP